MEQIKITPKLSSQMLEKYENIKKYDKNILLNLLTALSNKYFDIDKEIITNNLNLFFSENNKLSNAKILPTVITFQHILITTYTTKFGILTKKENRKKFMEYTFKDKIDKFIFDSCMISEKMYYFNNTIYSSESGYYYFITLMVVLNIFGFESDILTNESNKFIMKSGNKNIKLIKNEKIGLDDFEERVKKLYFLNRYISDEIKLENIYKVSVSIKPKLDFYNTEFGTFRKVKGICELFLPHNHHNIKETCELSYILYVILYSNKYSLLQFIEKQPESVKFFDEIFTNMEFREISWKNKTIIYIE